DFPLAPGSGLKLGAGLSVGYKVFVYRAPGNTDQDGVVTAAALGPASVWLKQELAASISGTLGATVKSVGFGLQGSASGEVRLLEYRQGKPGDPFIPALESAIAGARLAVRFSDVKLLDAQSQLALIAGGRLALSATLTWSDVFSASLSALDRVLGAAGASL